MTAMGKTFHFKKFRVQQDHCAMKVGTDGVLLGAWTSLTRNPQSILDIGAGTGLIALMLAQRSDAGQVDALEIDQAASEQCAENFQASPWGNRLRCYHTSLQEYVANTERRYDLIVSNPPFYSETVPGRAANRDLARQNRTLPFEALIAGVGSLLGQTGRFCAIVPYREESRVRSLAGAYSLFLRRITRVKGHPSAPLKRSLLEFSREDLLPETGSLVIEEGRHQYTASYRDLTSDFYLKM